MANIPASRAHAHRPPGFAARPHDGERERRAPRPPRRRPDAGGARGVPRRRRGPEPAGRDEAPPAAPHPDQAPGVGHVGAGGARVGVPGVPVPAEPRACGIPTSCIPGSRALPRGQGEAGRPPPGRGLRTASCSSGRARGARSSRPTSPSGRPSRRPSGRGCGCNGTPGTKAFDFEEAPTAQPLPEPAWPPVDVKILLGRALEKKKIASPDHPVVKALLTPGG